MVLLNTVFILFGGTGDLAYKKLLPSLYSLHEKKLLPGKFVILSLGRRMTNETAYKNSIKNSFNNFTPEFLSLIRYLKFDVNNRNDYSTLKNVLENIDKSYDTKGNRIFYLALPQRFSKQITLNLKTHKMINRDKGIHKIVVEKPFGNNLESSKKLNADLKQVFKEKEIYRIDHYLAKEAVTNLFVFRFSNKIFSDIWSNKYIDSVQITAAESIGVEERAQYYDNSGAVRDMVQSHILQILSLTSMEQPENLSSESISRKKVEILKDVKKFSDDDMANITVFGQYLKGCLAKDYVKENKVSNNSRTETYFAMKLEIENKRWNGVPFYIRTGKGLKEKRTEVVIFFKENLDNSLFQQKLCYPNVLTITIDPKPAIHLTINSKAAGEDYHITQEKMEFCHSCQLEDDNTKPYERLLYDIFKGKKDLFAMADEVYEAWKIIDKIVLNSNNKPCYYESGTWGPKESDILLLKQNKFWNNE